MLKHPATGSEVEPAWPAHNSTLGSYLAVGTNPLRNWLVSNYTHAYVEDCHRVFGEFLHHYPYLGVGGEQEKAKLRLCIETAQEVWGTR